MQPVYDIGVFSVTVLCHKLFIVKVEAGGRNDGADFLLDDFGFHVKIDGAGLAHIGALAAGNRHKTGTILAVKGVGGRYGLGEGNIDGFPAG